MLFNTELLYLLKIKDKNKIMILTGKAKESFIDYLDKTNQIKIEKGILNLHWQDLPEKFKNALIIEWFDSVGICIDRDCVNMEMVITDFRDTNEEQTIIDCDVEEPFPNWWKKAIEKANEIYNNTL